MEKWFAKLGQDFTQTFIDGNRWQSLLKGLGITLELTLFALIIGSVLGVIVAVIRSYHDQMAHNGTGKLLDFLDKLCRLYLTVIRGTPMMVQLLIMYFVIMASSTNTLLVATLSFGINSGAYVAEIIRGGIMAIDQGQMEAGRSLGLSYVQTMWHIIIPQAIKNILPALGNEFIVLMKDTSIVGYIALIDLAKGGDIIRSQTYSVYLPYLTVAAIYLVMVMTFTWLLGKLERHLRNTGADVVRNDG